MPGFLRVAGRRGFTGSVPKPRPRLPVSAPVQRWTVFAVLASLLYPAPAGADSSICSTGDLDGDGVADFVLASRDTRGPETVWAFSGRDGKAIWGVQTDVVGDGFGSAMACVPDVDDDGAAEVLIASPGESLTGESPDQEWRRVRTGRVRLFSGRSGSVLLELSADELFGAFGASVGTCGDLDGDRMPELLVGCPGARPGRVRAYSAKSGLEIREWVAPAHAGGTEAFGDAVCEITDFDADGVPDVLVGDSLAVKPGSKRQGRGRGRGTKDDWLIAEDENPTGCVRLFSGATGALLRTVWNDNSRDTGGSNQVRTHAGARRRRGRRRVPGRLRVVRRSRPADPFLEIVERPDQDSLPP